MKNKLKNDVTVNPAFSKKVGVKGIHKESDSTQEYKQQILALEELGVRASRLYKAGVLRDAQFSRICEYLAASENYYAIVSPDGANVERSKLLKDLLGNRKFVKDSISGSRPCRRTRRTFSGGIR